jgi:tRNA(fMet)-specific endonuclease VapC
MRYLLDTNTCIDYLRYPSSKVRARIQSCSPQEIALCSIVQAELYYGAWRSRNPSHNFGMIAAIALANGLTLITNNLREFERIPNLICEDWTV